MGVDEHCDAIDAGVAALVNEIDDLRDRVKELKSELNRRMDEIVDLQDSLTDSQYHLREASPY